MLCTWFFATMSLWSCGDCCFNEAFWVDPMFEWCLVFWGMERCLRMLVDVCGCFGNSTKHSCTFLKFAHLLKLLSLSTVTCSTRDQNLVLFFTLTSCSTEKAQLGSWTGLIGHSKGSTESKCFQYESAEKKRTSGDDCGMFGSTLTLLAFGPSSPRNAKIPSFVQ